MGTTLFSIYLKTLADSTLRQMKKPELIEYIRMCEKNMVNAYETLDQQAKNVEKLLKEQRQDNWIPCSGGVMPNHDQRTVTTHLLHRELRHVSTAVYYKEKGRLDEYEWKGEGFYQYSDGDYILRDDVIAWMPAEPYQEAME